MREEVQLSTKVVDYIYRIVAATRSHPLILSGISTRGAISLADTARAAAWLDGRDYVMPDDVQTVVGPVGAHRLILRPEHEAAGKNEVLLSIVKSLPVPLV